MTKKDYEMIAKAIALHNITLNELDEWKSSFIFKAVVNGLCLSFSRDNRRFDAAKFRKACGL